MLFLFDDGSEWYAIHAMLTTTDFGIIHVREEIANAKVISFEIHMENADFAKRFDYLLRLNNKTYRTRATPPS